MSRDSKRFLVSLLIGLMMIMVVGCATDLPPQWVRIGKLRDFPPSNHPFRTSIPATTLVNLDGTIHIFKMYATDGSEEREHCQVVWAEPYNRFEDRCGGSRFKLDGTIWFGISKRDLDEYPVKIIDGIIMADPTTIIKGECRIVPQDPDPNNYEATPPPCNP